MILAPFSQFLEVNQCINFSVYNAKMKILLVAPSPKNEGAEERDIAFGIKLLLDLGHDVRVIYVNSSIKSTCEFLQNNISKMGIRYLLMRYLYPDGQVRTWMNASGSCEILRSLIEDDFDLLWIETSALSVFSKFSSRPCILRSHNFDPIHFAYEAQSLIRRISAAVTKLFTLLLLESRAHTIIAISPKDRDRYRKVLFWKKSIHYIPLRYLGNEFWSAHAKDRANFRKKIAFLGSTFSVRHNRKALELIGSEVALRFPDIEFRIYGRKASSLQLYFPSNVKYLGWVENLDSIYEEEDVFLIPKTGGAGMKSKLFEPLFRGKICIAYIDEFVGINPRMFSNAIFFSNISQMFEEIDKLINNPFQVRPRTEFNNSSYRQQLDSFLNVKEDIDSLLQIFD